MVLHVASRHLSGDLSEVGKVGHGTQPAGLGFQLVESFTESVNDLIEGGSSHIGELLFAQVLPYMLNGIEFRTVGWLLDQANILGNLEVLGLVPLGLIDLHDDKVL